MARARITKVVDRDTDRVLFEADRAGNRITFHVCGPAAQQMADLVEAGEAVEVDL